MNITSFAELLAAARSQPEPQRLLLTFVGAELPDDATPEQQAHHDAGHSGALFPLMCVDKDPQALVGFAELADEASSFGHPWVLVFAAAMGGRAGLPPQGKAVETALQAMVESVRSGAIDRYIPFDRNGCAVQFVS